MASHMYVPSKMMRMMRPAANGRGGKRGGAAANAASSAYASAPGSESSARPNGSGATAPSSGGPERSSAPPLSVLAGPGLLKTDSGHAIPELKFTPSMFLDRTTVLYGPSKTGKTVHIKNILKTLNGFCSEILIIAPTDIANRSYDGFVDSPCIHYRLWIPDPKNPKKDDGVKGTHRFLDAIWQRQNMKAAIFSRANKLDTLARLFARLPPAAHASGTGYLKLIRRKRERVIAELDVRFAHDIAKRTAKKKEVDEKFKQITTIVFKKHVVPHYELLAGLADLSEDERYSLRYVNFNPRLVIVFDDCAAQLKPMFNKEGFRQLFYQNRHALISTVVCCQDDTDLPPNLKKNTFVSIFTEAVVTSSFFDRSTNKFPKSTRAYVSEVVPSVFKGHRKLAYIRDDESRQHFYYTNVPDLPPSMFGSPALHELCNLLKADGPSMDKENPYFDKFKV